MTSTQKHEFKLTDEDSLNLGILTCWLPLDFDTTYRWIDRSDCMCCDAVMYRCHSSKFDVITENGFLSGTHLDSGFYFTISHFPSISCDTGSEYVINDKQSASRNNKIRIEEFIKNLEQSGGSKVIVDTNRIINKNKFDIFYFTKKDYYKILVNDSYLLKTVTFNTLSAATKHRDRYIGIRIQNNVHQSDSFYIIAMNILKTIEIH